LRPLETKALQTSPVAAPTGLPSHARSPDEPILGTGRSLRQGSKPRSTTAEAGRHPDGGCERTRPPWQMPQTAPPRSAKPSARASAGGCSASAGGCSASAGGCGDRILEWSGRAALHVSADLPTQMAALSTSSPPHRDAPGGTQAVRCGPSRGENPRNVPPRGLGARSPGPQRKVGRSNVAAGRLIGSPPRLGAASAFPLATRSRRLGTSGAIIAIGLGEGDAGGGRRRGAGPAQGGGGPAAPPAVATAQMAHDA
jgi:hypothetical protein